MRINNKIINKTMKNKNTVLFLAFFFWSFWIHRFYLNQKVIGIIFLLLFICFPMVWLCAWLIDFLNFLIMNSKTFNKLYNSKLKQCDECLEYINVLSKKCKNCGSIIK